jgi:hypothetical protein
MNRNLPLEAEFGKTIAALPGNSFELFLALTCGISSRRWKVNYYIFSPKFLSLLHGEGYHLHGQFPSIPIHIAKKRPRWRFGIPVKLDQGGMYAPLKFMVLNQALKPRELISRKIIELASLKIVADYHLLEKIEPMTMKAKVTHDDF